MSIRCHISRQIPQRTPDLLKSKPGAQTAFRLLSIVTVHAFLLALVVLIPVRVYEAVSSYANDGHLWAFAFVFIGGATYPLYGTYWLLKAKSLTFKLASVHVLSLITLSLLVSGVCDQWKMPTVQVAFPIAWSLLALPVAVYALARRNAPLLKASIVTALVTLPFALALSVFLWFGQGLSVMR